MLYFYRVFELTLASDLELPELEIATSTEQCDVTLRIGPVSRHGLDSPNATGLFYQAAANVLWLEALDEARFLIKDGTDIVVDALPTADPRSIRLYVLGACLGAILMQRGFLTLHANTIVVDGGAVIFAGGSGAGKSTLAGAFNQRGYTVLSDDLTAINGQYEVVPGVPRIKLWRDSATMLDIGLDQHHQIRDQVDKYHIPIQQNASLTSYPVKAVYILHPYDQDTVKFYQISGWHTYRPLRKTTFRYLFAKGMALTQHHLAQCAELSKRASIWHLYRPRHIPQDELLATLLEHVEARLGK